MNFAAFSIFSRTKELTRFISLRTQLIEIDRNIGDLDTADAKRLVGLVENRIKREAEVGGDTLFITKDAMLRLKTSNSHLKLYAISGWIEAVLRETAETSSVELTELNRRVRKMMRTLRESVEKSEPKQVRHAMQAVI